ncbi:hypothetical protein [Microbulbifer halophilus]|uniref:Terminase small subunit n=1 Tax=Microbulbifer halophilus TaxID=453963 RepID=A0ABW5EFB6_9GAMM|nr:hypothetical protein [Microbulbifer halophilus]MCW8125765.1 hypothetical protein [Microbulbifer halophilus]
MSKKGRRPKPARLHLVSGTHRPGRHGDATSKRARTDRDRSAFGALKKPPSLKGEGAKAWKRWIEPAYWLDASREPAAIAFCELWKEMMVNPASFQAAKHSQLRGYMAELGLTDERNRAEKKDDEEDEFFDD